MHIQALSTGADVAIVIGSVLLLLSVLTTVYIAGSRLYKRRKERQHARVASRELDLDFDTTDVEFSLGRRVTKSHLRGWSDSSTDSSRPLIKSGAGWSAQTPSSYSFDSERHSLSSVASLPNPHPPSPENFRPGTQAAPPPKVEQTVPPSADYQLSSLLSRPSFLTRPREPPRPGQPRSRSRPSDMRSNLLTRLASAKSIRRTRSAERAEEGDSPSSVYSQASAAMPDYQEFQADSVNGRLEAPPPVPPLPPQFQKEQLSQVASSYARPPSHPPVPGPPVAGWRPDIMANNTLDSNPFSRMDAGKRDSLPDSVAFQLPSPELPSPMKGSHTHWFSAQSPSSGEPSPTTADVLHPSHSAYASILARPADQVHGYTTKESNKMNVRTVEASRDVPAFSVVHSHQGESGMVGYQLPADWRLSGLPTRGVSLYDPPVAAYAAQ